MSKTVPSLAHALRAEVETADELAHREQVDVVEQRRANVCVHVERRPQAKQALLRADVCRIELGIPDRPLEHGCRRQAGVDRLLGERRPGCTNCGTADQPLVERDLGREQLEGAPRFLGDLGADSVPW